jgi:hypothetical protein
MEAAHGVKKHPCLEPFLHINDNIDPDRLGTNIGKVENKGPCVFLQGDVQQAVYMGPHYPNSTTDEISADFVGHCGNGCLYNIEADPVSALSKFHSFHAWRASSLHDT